MRSILIRSTSCLRQQKCQIPSRGYNNCRSFSSSSTSFTKQDDQNISDTLRQVMRRSAQPVAVITTNLPDSIAKDSLSSSSSSNLSIDQTVYAHGATLSSFTTVSLDPPLVAFSLRIPSRLAEALSKNEKERNGNEAHFVINILSHKQELAAEKFSKPGLPPFPLPKSWKKSGSEEEHQKLEGTDSHPFNLMSIKPSEASSTQANSHPVIILSDSIGGLSCSLVQRFNLQNVSLNQGIDKEKSSQSRGGSDLFLARVHSIEDFTEGDKNRLPLIYWDRKFSTPQ